MIKDKRNTKLYFLLGLLVCLMGSIQLAQAANLSKKVDLFLRDADLVIATQALTRETGIQFLVIPGQQPFEKINLSIKGAVPEDAVLYICQAAGGWAERDANGVYIVRKGVKPELIQDHSHLLVIKKVFLTKSDALKIYETLVSSTGLMSESRLKEEDRFSNAPKDPQSGTQGSSAQRTPVEKINTSQMPSAYIVPSSEIQKIDISENAQVMVKNPSAHQSASSPFARSFGNASKSISFPSGSGAGHGLIPAGIEYLTYDPTDNSLIVKGSDEAVRKLQQNVALLDVAPKQVLIKVEFIETTLNHNLDFGVDWFVSKQVGDGALSSGTFNPNVTTSTTVGSSTAGPTTTTSSTTTSSATAGDFANPADPFFIKYLKGSQVAQLRAALTDGNSKVVDSPILRTLNNQEASIRSINTRTEILDSKVIVEGVNNANIAQTPTDFTVTTQLLMKPRINEDGTITLNINPQIESHVPSTEKHVRFEKLSRQANLVTRVKDGETIVIGGLVRKDVRRTRNKIPVLGDIPILGYLFGRTTEVIVERELLIFITTKIVSDDAKDGG